MVKILDGQILPPYKAAAVMSVVKPGNGGVSARSRLQPICLDIEADRALSKYIEKAPVLSAFQYPGKIFCVSYSEFDRCAGQQIVIGDFSFRADTFDLF